jgi:hypothetical protein
MRKASVGVFPIFATALLASVFHSSVRAQAPDVDRVVYTNVCTNRESGDTHGEALILTKSETGHAFQFADYTSQPHPPLPITGQITGDKISFEFNTGFLLVRFAGTITPDEIKGRYSNDRKSEYYNAEVRLERVPPGAARGYCHN